MKADSAFIRYIVYICILKFDFFFFVAFSLQFWLLVPDQSASEVCAPI